MAWARSKFLVVSFMVVLLAACASSSTAESTGEFLDSSLITTKIKAKLIDDAVTSGFSIKVNTYKGSVQLSGFVNTDLEKSRAMELALAVEGVKEVKNDLIIK